MHVWHILVSSSLLGDFPSRLLVSGFQDTEWCGVYVDRWDVNDYADAFRAMLSQHGGFTHMLLSSDDKNVYSNMEAAIQHVAANREDPRRHVLPFPPQDESTRIVHIPMGYWRVMNGNENMPAASRITAAYNVASNHSQVCSAYQIIQFK